MPLRDATFVHPRSHTPLLREAGGFRCPETGEFFPHIAGVPTFTTAETQRRMDEERSGVTNVIKTFLRRFPRLYVALIYVISPICFVGTSATTFLRRFSADAQIVNIGSGIHRFPGNVINVDIFPYRGVDVVADARALPFMSNSTDGVICECLLEHVPDPQRVVAEILRILRPGGQAYLSVPFVYPFHASPNDFHRWTIPGLRVLCGAATVDVVAPRSGPVSALVAQITSSTAVLLSLGSHALYAVLVEIFQVVLCPLKVLDFLLGRLPTAGYCPASLYAIITKPNDSDARRTPPRAARVGTSPPQISEATAA